MSPWLVDQQETPESFLDILIKICSKFKENPLTSFFFNHGLKKSWLQTGGWTHRKTWWFQKKVAVSIRYRFSTIWKHPPRRNMRLSFHSFYRDTNLPSRLESFPTTIRSSLAITSAEFFFKCRYTYISTMSIGQINVLVTCGTASN